MALNSNDLLVSVDLRFHKWIHSRCSCDYFRLSRHGKSADLLLFHKKMSNSIYFLFQVKFYLYIYIFSFIRKYRLGSVFVSSECKHKVCFRFYHLTPWKSLQTFFSHLNSRHCHIKFTMKLLTNDSFSFWIYLWRVNQMVIKVIQFIENKQLHTDFY